MSFPKRDDKWWWDKVVPFGKHKGELLYMVYTNDLGYIKWLDQTLDLQGEFREAVTACLEHSYKQD